MKKIKRILTNKVLIYISDKNLIKLIYIYKLKRFLNLKNPKTLNEKIQWLKLYDRTDLHTLCADKLKVRPYIKELVGEKYLIPLVFSTKNVEDIKPENLPDYPIIIKTNHDSGTFFIIKDKVKQDWKSIRKELKKALLSNYYYASREWQYKNIEPFIIVEKLLLTDDKKVPMDLKLHCFNGKVEFIQVDINRETNHCRSFFNIDWELLNFGLGYPRGQKVLKPENLSLLVSLAEKISSKFYLSRIDFYELKGMVFFGEITLHHGSGYEQFSPKEKDLEYGNLLKLPVNKFSI